MYKVETSQKEDECKNIHVSAVTTDSAEMEVQSAFEVY
jgi:hypothetical protein